MVTAVRARELLIEHKVVDDFYYKVMLLEIVRMIGKLAIVNVIDRSKNPHNVSVHMAVWNCLL